jgi:hypothetical protein
MDEKTNSFHAFLIEKGVPKKLLPSLIKVSKDNLLPIMEGCKNNENECFYVCVCTSGHSVGVSQWKWAHSGWVMRVRGKSVIFSRHKREMNITEIPIFNDVIFVVSKRTQANETAQDRTDIVCVLSNRKKLVRNRKKPETQRRCNGKLN